MKRILIILTILFLSIFDIFATPQISLLSGNKCINCHYNSSGGGLRTTLGWYSKKDDGLIQPSKIGLGKTFDSIGGFNDIFNQKARFGLDSRYMTIRPGGSLLQDRIYFIMLWSPSLVISPVSWMNIVGQYNFAKTPMLGQTHYMAYVQLQPDLDYPTLQIGYFQPPIGLRSDDHTLATKQVATTNFSPLYPVDYQELGAMFNYESVKWLGLSAGIFTNNNLSKTKVSFDSTSKIPAVGQKSMSSVVKAVLSPRFLENKLNTQLGGSVYYNNGGNYSIYNVFFGLGYSDLVALSAEYAIYENKNLIKTNNYSVELGCSPTSYSYFFGRIESGITDYKALTANYSLADYVIGAKVDILPYFELQPEYRIFRNTDLPSYSAYYAVQLHVFY